MCMCMYMCTSELAPLTWRDCQWQSWVLTVENMRQVIEVNLYTYSTPKKSRAVRAQKKGVRTTFNRLTV